MSTDVYGFHPNYNLSKQKRSVSPSWEPPLVSGMERLLELLPPISQPFLYSPNLYSHHLKYISSNLKTDLSDG